jgi:hypothetical protein
MVDVDHQQAGALEEVHGHAVDVAAVEEDDRALVDVVRRPGHDVVEAHVAVLRRQVRLGLGDEHDRVLPEAAEDLVHAEQGAEGVPVGVLVRRQEELVGLAEALDHLVEGRRERHRPVPSGSGAPSASSRSMRMALSTDSS